AGNRKSNGLEFSRRFRCGAKPRVRIYSLVVLFRRCDGMGNAARAQSRDVVRLRAWIALHFVLFLAIGLLGVGVRRAIALPPGGHFGDQEQWIICAAAAGIMLVIMGIAATSARHVCSG